MVLYIIRHATAKNIGEDGIKDDFNRTLSTKGIEEATNLAHYLKEKNIFFDQVLHSPALRTVETATIVSDGLSCKRIEKDLLEPTRTVDDYYKTVQQNISCKHLAIVGHNTMVSKLVCLIIGADIRSRIHLKKCAMAVLEVEPSNFGELRGYLYTMITPKYL